MPPNYWNVYVISCVDKKWCISILCMDKFKQYTSNWKVGYDVKNIGYV